MSNQSEKSPKKKNKSATFSGKDSIKKTYRVGAQSAGSDVINFEITCSNFAFTDKDSANFYTISPTGRSSFVAHIKHIIFIIEADQSQHMNSADTLPKNFGKINLDHHQNNENLNTFLMTGNPT